MKSNKLIIALFQLLVVVPPLFGQSDSKVPDPAVLPIDSVLDFKVAKPEVDVNLPRFLLLDALSEVDLGTNSPFAASGISLQELVKDIKLIRLVVISSDSSNQSHVDQAMTALSKHVQTNWVSIISVPDENIGFYAMSDPSGEGVGGLALLIHNDGETVIGNIVGRVSIGKLLKVASKFDSKSGMSFIPKELIERFSGASSAGPGSAQEPEANSEKTP